MSRMTVVVAMSVALSVGLTATPRHAEASIKHRAKKMSDKAAKLFAQHKYRDAAELFEKAYALDSAKLIRLRNAGRAYEEARMHSRALHCFKRYLERASTPKLREDAKTRIARLEARMVAEQEPAAAMGRAPMVPSAGAASGASSGADKRVAGADKRVAGADSSSPPVATGAAASAATPAVPTFESDAAIQVGSPRSLALPAAVGVGGVVAMIGGGALIYLASSAATDVDAAEAKGDYGYSGGSDKLVDDRAAISLNRGVGWGLVGVGAVGAGVAAWWAMRGDGAARTALLPAALLPTGPADGAGVTALFRF